MPSSMFFVDFTVYATTTHLIFSTTRSPPPTARVADSECSTSSEKDEDSEDQRDEEEEQDGDNGDGAESEGEEWYDREWQYKRAEWEYESHWQYEREAGEYERKDKDGHNFEDEDIAPLNVVNAVVGCGNIQSPSETPQTSTTPSVTRAVDDSESASTNLPSQLPLNIDAPYESQGYQESSTQDPGLEAGEL
jgi:hypothetical protein